MTKGREFRIRFVKSLFEKNEFSPILKMIKSVKATLQMILQTPNVSLANIREVYLNVLLFLEKLILRWEIWQTIMIQIYSRNLDLVNSFDRMILRMKFQIIKTASMVI